MKRLFTIFVVIISIALGTRELHAQWVQTNWPVGCCASPTGIATLGTNLFIGGWLGVSYGGVVLSTDFGSTWTVMNDSLQRPFALIGTTLFACGSTAILSSNDTGKTWKTTKGVGWPTTYFNVRCLAVLGTNLFATTQDLSGTICRSTDSGASWSVIKLPGLPSIGDLGTSGSVLFAVTGEIYSSPDSGTSWAIDSLSGLYPIVFTRCGSALFVGGGLGGVSRTTNNGTSWTSVNNDLDVFSFAVSDTNLFVLTYDSGVYLTTNLGTTWSFESQGLPRAPNTYPRGEMAACGPYLFLATDTEGVFRRLISEMIGTNAVNLATPSNGISLNSYPDPTASRTTLSFTLPEPGAASLTLTDAVGRETPLLHSAWLATGPHEVTWDASGFPSGIYFLRLSENGYVQTRQISIEH